MKNINKVLILIISFPLLFGACDEYLDQTEFANVSDVDIFDNYPMFAGYVDQLYQLWKDRGSEQKYCLNLSDQLATSKDNNFTAYAHRGDYYSIIAPFWLNPLMNTKGADQGLTNFDVEGLWPEYWYGIRVCNLGLENIDRMETHTKYDNFTPEQQYNFLKGQMLFFRAFYYFEITSIWGGMPYITKVLDASKKEDINAERESFQANADMMIADFLAAAELLPANYAPTADAPGRFDHGHGGRITKGAAYAMAGKAALYAGSPLMNGTGPNKSYTYNMGYMEQAASYFAQVIALADSGVYELVPLDNQPIPASDNNNYYANFTDLQKTPIWTKETILSKVKGRGGLWRITHTQGAKYIPAVVTPGVVIGGSGTEKLTPTNNLVEMFETINGYPIDKDPDFDELNPWDDRDPRMRQNILFDRDNWVEANPSAVFELYEGGRTHGSNDMTTSFLCKKYWPLGANKSDTRAATFDYACPYIRLADVYLMYAEAANEAWGPLGTAPGASLNAIEAVNVVRSRVGVEMPDIDITYDLSTTEKLRHVIWNERSVELCFEHHKWYDVRRWYIAHLNEVKNIHSDVVLQYSKTLYDVTFNKEWSYFSKQEVENIVFDKKHYWMPIPREQTFINSNFKQNPGWN